METSQLICFENHLTGFCMLRVSKWTIVYFNSLEELSEEYSSISIHRALFYNKGILFYMYSANTRIKPLLQAKNKVFNNYRKNKTNIQLLNKINILRERLNGLISKSKNNYYEHMANKLNNLQRNSKAYWCLLKCLLNNKKVALIPSLFHENKFITNFLKKAELFNSFFSKQCSLINNGSTLHTHIQYLTINCLSSVTLSQDNIAKVIQKDKAHGHDNISIRMLKICGSAICGSKPFSHNF